MVIALVPVLHLQYFIKVLCAGTFSVLQDSTYFGGVVSQLVEHSQEWSTDALVVGLSLLAATMCP